MNKTSLQTYRESQPEILFLAGNRKPLYTPAKNHKTRDTFTKTNASNNGQFDILEAAKQFGKGVISPFAVMFSSVQNFVVGAGLLAGAGALMVAVPSLGVSLVALGVISGAITTGVGIYKTATAKDGDEVEKAFFNFGQATLELGTSWFGAKGLLKHALNIDEFNDFQALRKILNAKTQQSALSAGWKAIKSPSKMFANVKATLGRTKNVSPKSTVTGKNCSTNTSSVVDDVPAVDFKPATRLTQKVTIQGDQFTIVSVPKVLEASPPSRYEVIAIVDDFHNKTIPIGATKRVSHGELVQRFATSGLEDEVAVLAYDIEGLEGLEGLVNALSDIRAKQATGTSSGRIKKVNLSLGQNGLFGTNCDGLSTLTGLRITEGTLLPLREQIIERLDIPETTRAIEEINALVDSGIDVYIAAGNEGPGNINLLALSRAKIIGATDSSGRIAALSNETPLVTNHAQGVYGVRPVYNTQGEFTGLSTSDSGPLLFTADEIGELDLGFLGDFIGKTADEIVNRQKIPDILQEYEKIKGSISFVDDAATLRQDYNTGNLLVPVNDDFFRFLAFREMKNRPFDLEVEATTEVSRRLSGLEKASYAAFDPAKNKWIGFITDKNGKLMIDFDGSGQPGQLAQISGTSFATPKKINEDILGNPEITVQQAPVKASESLVTLEELTEYSETINKWRKYNMLSDQEAILSGDERIFRFAGTTREKFLAIREKLSTLSQKA